MGGESWLLIEEISVIPHIKIKIYKVWRTNQQKQSAVFKGHKKKQQGLQQIGARVAPSKPIFLFFALLCLFSSTLFLLLFIFFFKPQTVASSFFFEAVDPFFFFLFETKREPTP